MHIQKRANSFVIWTTFQFDPILNSIQKLLFQFRSTYFVFLFFLFFSSFNTWTNGWIFEVHTTSTILLCCVYGAILWHALIYQMFKLLYFRQFTFFSSLRGRILRFCHHRRSITIHKTQQNSFDIFLSQMTTFYSACISSLNFVQSIRDKMIQVYVNVKIHMKLFFFISSLVICSRKTKPSSKCFGL